MRSSNSFRSPIPASLFFAFTLLLTSWSFVALNPAQASDRLPEPQIIIQGLFEGMGMDPSGSLYQYMVSDLLANRALNSAIQSEDPTETLRVFKRALDAELAYALTLREHLHGGQLLDLAHYASYTQKDEVTLLQLRTKILDALIEGSNHFRDLTTFTPLTEIGLDLQTDIFQKILENPTHTLESLLNSAKKETLRAQIRLISRILERNANLYPELFLAFLSLSKGEHRLLGTDPHQIIRDHFYKWESDFAAFPPDDRIYPLIEKKLNSLSPDIQAHWILLSEKPKTTTVIQAHLYFTQHKGALKSLLSELKDSPRKAKILELAPLLTITESDFLDLMKSKVTADRERARFYLINRYIPGLKSFEDYRNFTEVASFISSLNDLQLEDEIYQRILDIRTELVQSSPVKRPILKSMRLLVRSRDRGLTYILDSAMAEPSKRLELLTKALIYYGLDVQKTTSTEVRAQTAFADILLNSDTIPFLISPQGLQTLWRTKPTAAQSLTRLILLMDSVFREQISNHQLRYREPAELMNQALTQLARTHRLNSDELHKFLIERIQFYLDYTPAQQDPKFNADGTPDIFQSQSMLWWKSQVDQLEIMMDQINPEYELIASDLQHSLHSLKKLYRTHFPTSQCSFILRNIDLTDFASPN